MEFKSRLLLGSVLTIWGSSLLVAQEPGSDPRKRMVFPAGAAEPAPSATPVATPAAPASKRETPETSIETFFLALKAGQVEAAYDQLTRGTVIAERAEGLRQLKNRTKEALDSYGPISGYESVNVLTAGKSLVRHTCISLNEDLPLRWRFYFYRGPNGWKLVDLRVDDGLVELFEEVVRDPKKPD